MAFGEILRQARIERGWTKEYVSERTKIMVKKIDALETENHDAIPAPLYGRGFIKRYAELLGIDAAPLIEDYNASVPGEDRAPKPVTVPAVTEPPARPLEPIHTGAHRTLPTQEPIRPQGNAVHKHVEPAQDSFTSVPKPEEMSTTPQPTSAQQDDLFAPPPAPEPPQPVEAPFTLSADPLPPSAENAPLPHPANPHRAIFSKSFEQEKRERMIVTRNDRQDELRSTATGGQRKIFGVHEPLAEPQSPQMGSFCDIFKGIGEACTGLITRATRPKVKRLHGDEGRYGTPRMLYQALLIFLLLVGLTGLVFLFRYVFRLSDAANPEYDETVAREPAAKFELRPVATPPEAYLD